MWECPLQSSTLKIPKKLQKEFKKYSEHTGLGYFEIDKKNIITTIPDIFEHYDSAMRDLAPFVLNHRLEGEIIYFDTNEGYNGYFAKYQFINGKLKYSSQKYGKKYTKNKVIKTKNYKEACEKRKVIFEYSLMNKNEDLVSIFEVKDINDRFIEYQIYREDELITKLKEIKLNQIMKLANKRSKFNLKNFKERYANYPVKQSNYFNYIKDENLKKELKNFFNEQFRNELLKQKKIENNKKEEVYLKSLINNPKILTPKKFLKMLNLHYSEINEHIPKKCKIENFSSLWKEKNGIIYLDQTKEFFWSRHNTNGTYADDVWEDSSWYAWDEEFYRINFNERENKYNILYNLIEFSKRYGIEFKEIDSKIIGLRKFQKILAIVSIK